VLSIRDRDQFNVSDAGTIFCVRFRLMIDLEGTVKYEEPCVQMEHKQNNAIISLTW
jgi:hypothetical protein